MSHRSRWEYFRAIYARYRQADRKLKRVILSEFCANTGYHRKYAIRLLNGPPAANYIYDHSTVTIGSWTSPTLGNPAGRLVAATTGNPSAPTTTAINSYDPVGRVAEQWQCTPINCGTAGAWFTFSYAYNLMGEETSITPAAIGCASNCSNGSFTLYDGYDAEGRVNQLTSSVSDPNHPGTLVSGVAYNAADEVTKMLYGNGLTEARAFNNRLQPCRFNLNSSGTGLSTCTDAVPSGNVQDYSYTYNGGSGNNGDVGSETATGTQAFNRSYTYDGVNRLGTMSAPGDTCSGLSWTYDEWGNRTAQTTTGGSCYSWSQSVNGNNQIAGFTYDASGDLTNDGTHTYQYDAEGRMISVDSGSTASYVYDAFGRRAEKAAPSGGLYGATQEHYWYDTAGRIRTIWDQNGSWIVDHFYLGPEYVGSYSTFFVFKDALGSTRLLTAVNQSVADSLDYMPYGEQIAGATDTNLKFTGLERDQESDFDHALFRQSSNSAGRWMSPDALGGHVSNPQSLKRYAYVLNDPKVLIDPLGHRR